MRKRLKLKKRSCSLCKPHKMHIENRWKPKDEAKLSEWESEQKGHLGTMKEETRKEACCVCDTDCENPAAWGGSYGIAINTHIKKIPICVRCGYGVCKACSEIREYLGEQSRLCNNCISEVERENAAATG